MKKILTAALALLAAIALTACGPDDDTLTLSTGDIQNGVTTESTPTVTSFDASETTLSETEPPATEPAVTTTPEQMTQVTTTEATTVATTVSAATTTKATKATTTEATKASETVASSNEVSLPVEEEEEDLGPEEIPNLDEFLASLGIDDSGGLNAGD